MGSVHLFDGIFHLQGFAVRRYFKGSEQFLRLKSFGELGAFAASVLLQSLFDIFGNACVDAIALALEHVDKPAHFFALFIVCLVEFMFNSMSNSTVFQKRANIFCG